MYTKSQWQNRRNVEPGWCEQAFPGQGGAWSPVKFEAPQGSRVGTETTMKVGGFLHDMAGRPPLAINGAEKNR